MKTIFLLLLAVMLLSCTSAFAQSDNNTPAKGDVNEDGTVDVADIVSVIDIMKNGGGTATVGYFYLGTTKPTDENYKTLPGVVTSYASFDDALGATASVAAGQTLYLLCPAAWMKGKDVTLADAVTAVSKSDERASSSDVPLPPHKLPPPAIVLMLAAGFVFVISNTFVEKVC